VHYLDRKNDARKKNGVKDRQCPSHEVDVPPHEVWPCLPAWLSLSWSLAGDVAQRRARRVERVDRPSGHRRYSTGRKLLKPIACTRARVGQHDRGDAWCESCHCIPRARRAGQRRRLSAMRVPKGSEPQALARKHSSNRCWSPTDAFRATTWPPSAVMATLHRSPSWSTAVSANTTTGSWEQHQRMASQQYFWLGSERRIGRQSGIAERMTVARSPRAGAARCRGG